MRNAIRHGTVLVVLGSLVTLVDLACTKEKPEPATQQVQYRTYVVQKGDFIIKIANQNNLPWESVMLLNEEELMRRANERCNQLPPKYTNNPRRRGYFCNEMLSYQGKQIVGANSLKPGDIIKLPKDAPPAQIAEVVGRIQGKNVVIVIDDTGSMQDTRAQVANWYMREVAAHGKDIRRVILFADGQVREYDAAGVEFYTVGDIENTRAALERAADYNPDAIILVSDEPGDDWNNFEALKLPPVIAHSLDPIADPNLSRVAKLSGGEFVSSTSNQIARN